MAASTFAIQKSVGPGEEPYSSDIPVITMSPSAATVIALADCRMSPVSRLLRISFPRESSRYSRVSR